MRKKLKSPRKKNNFFYKNYFTAKNSLKAKNRNVVNDSIESWSKRKENSWCVTFDKITRMPDLPLSGCLEKGAQKAMGRVGRGFFAHISSSCLRRAPGNRKIASLDIIALLDFTFALTQNLAFLQLDFFR